MLIVGSMVKSLAASTQLSCYYAMGELVPMKYRYLIIGVLNIWQLPGSSFSAAIAESLAIHSSVGWRAVFWLLSAVNGSSMICYFFFYHPPTFHDKHGMREKRIDFVKNFDYIGTFLYAVGLVFFLLGMSWGGNKYAWDSAYVISFIVIGVCSLISFVCWERYAALKEPLIPLELFRNRPFVVSTLLTGIGAGVYYAGASMSLISPFEVAGLTLDQSYGHS